MEKKIRRMQNSWREVATGKNNLELRTCYVAEEELNDRQTCCSSTVCGTEHTAVRILCSAGVGSWGLM
jgi:hypothetical protein